MKKLEQSQWEKFQLLMQFLDDWRNHGIWYCRRTTEKERKSGGEFYMFTDLNFEAVEKAVRRYLKLPSKDQTERELTKMLDDIRKKHAEDTVREALPGVLND